MYNTSLHLPIFDISCSGSFPPARSRGSAGLSVVAAGAFCWQHGQYTLVWVDLSRVHRSFGPVVIWSSSHLVQQSFGPAVIWSSSHLVQQNFLDDGLNCCCYGSTYCCSRVCWLVVGGCGCGCDCVC